jgi:hypothetical protein
MIDVPRERNWINVTGGPGAREIWDAGKQNAPRIRFFGLHTVMTERGVNEMASESPINFWMTVNLVRKHERDGRLLTVGGEIGMFMNRKPFWKGEMEFIYDTQTQEAGFAIPE